MGRMSDVNLNAYVGQHSRDCRRTIGLMVKSAVDLCPALRHANNTSYEIPGCC